MSKQAITEPQAGRSREQSAGERAVAQDFRSAEQILEYVSRHKLSEHPFIRRIGRTEDDGGLIWLLVTNTYEGTSVHFVRWLATVTARVEDDAIRSLLARQLNQELGEGDISRAHSVLMRGFLDALEPLRPAHFEDAMLASGRRLGKRLEEHYMSQVPLEGVAALMAGEICAEQMIRAVARLLRSKPRPFDPGKLDWLTEHDELEGGHADESLIMARMIPDQVDALAAVRRGALGVHTALWDSLDELAFTCFGALPEG